MPVSRCYICEQSPDEVQALGHSGLQEGQPCPICHRPVCRRHLVRVRWRWRTPARELDSTLICRECHRVYAHRNWDPIHREWIS